MNLQIVLFCFFVAMSLHYTQAGEVSDESDTEKKVTSLKNTMINVAIVGGGFAGLAAFKRLQPIGLQKLDLFEASDRLGGRVYPIPFEDGYLQHGAEYIHSLGNPVFDMAKQLNLINDSYDFGAEDLFDSAEFKTGKCELDEDLTEEFKKFAIKFENNLDKLAEDEDSWKKTVGEVYDEKLETFIEKEDRNKEEINQINALSEFYKSYFEGDWSVSINNLSLRNFDTWDPLTKNKSTIELNKIGYKAILDELTKDLPRESVHLSSKVTLVDYSDEQTKLKINGNKFHETQYDYVIVTVPLGHLKAHANEMFEPKLPQQKSDIIEALGFGALLKLFLVYDKPFWAEDGHDVSFVPLQIEGCATKSPIASTLLSTHAVHWKRNVLLVWVNGEANKLIDEMSDSELSTQITDLFKATMTNVTVIPPKRIIRKSWLKDDNYLGSYSFITPESAKFDDPFKLLAKPVYNKQRPRILFAGEATHSQIYQTTSGAYLSGEREAERLLKLAKKYQSK